MGGRIVIETTYTHQVDREAISLEQWRIKRERRRKRVARRMAQRFPLFAVEFTREEFKNYTQEQFEQDMDGARLPKKRKGKSPMARQGRYLAMKEALSNYRQTKDEAYLREAQALRRRLFQPYLVRYRLGKEAREFQFPSTTSYKLILDLVSIQFTSWEELEEILEEKTRWIHVS